MSMKCERGMNVLGTVGVRESDRRLLAEIQARNNEDQRPRWDGDRCPEHGDQASD